MAYASNFPMVGHHLESSCCNAPVFITGTSLEYFCTECKKNPQRVTEIKTVKT